MQREQDSGDGRDYRRRIYAGYGRTIQDAPDGFDDKGARRWSAARDWYLRGWLPQDKRARIADLACGRGWLLFYLKGKGYQEIHGVDISPDQVRASRQVTPSVVHGDVISFLTDNPRRFDLLIGFDIVEHLYKDEALRFLDSAYNALRDDGRLVLQTPNAASPWGGAVQYGDFTHEVGYSPAGLSRVMRLAGFADIECRECDPPRAGYSASSAIRAALWQCIRLSLSACNIIETGSRGDGVWTRVFLASGVRRS